MRTDLPIPEGEGGFNTDRRLEESYSRNHDSSSQCSITLESDGSEKWCHVCDDGGNFVCCSTCPKVFHPQCHVPPINMPVESLSYAFLKSCDDWRCSLCAEVEPLHKDSRRMGSRERLLCAKVLLRCYNAHDVAQYFNILHTEELYLLVVGGKPMTFDIIAERLKEDRTDSFQTLTEFIEAMNLVFMNCSWFNEPGNYYEFAGRRVHELYAKAVEDFLPCMCKEVWKYVPLYMKGRLAAALYCIEMRQMAVNPQKRKSSGDEGARPFMQPSSDVAESEKASESSKSDDSETPRKRTRRTPKRYEY